MLKIMKELCIFISTLFLCYISYKLNCYNTMIIYLLVRIWVENELKD